MFWRQIKIQNAHFFCSTCAGVLVLNIPNSKLKPIKAKSKLNFWRISHLPFIFNLRKPILSNSLSKAWNAFFSTHIKRISIFTSHTYVVPHLNSVTFSLNFLIVFCYLWIPSLVVFLKKSLLTYEYFELGINEIPFLLSKPNYENALHGFENQYTLLADLSI